MNISNRETSLQQLQTFIKENKRKTDTLLQALGWTSAKTLQEACLRKKRELENEPSIATKHTIVIEPHTFNTLVGNTLDCDSSDNLFMTELNAEQKLALYEYCIEKTGKLSEPEITIKFEEESGMKKEMTFAEIVAKRRNLKRRTTRYRTGASQSYVGELRNLIEIQMSALRQYIDDNSNKYEERKHRETESSRISKGHQSSSRHRGYDHERKSSYKHKKYKRKSPERYRSRD